MDGHNKISVDSLWFASRNPLLPTLFALYFLSAMPVGKARKSLNLFYGLFKYN